MELYCAALRNGLCGEWRDGGPEGKVGKGGRIDGPAAKILFEGLQHDVVHATVMLIC